MHRLNLSFLQTPWYIACMLKPETSLGVPHPQRSVSQRLENPENAEATSDSLSPNVLERLHLMLGLRLSIAFRKSSCPVRFSTALLPRTRLHALRVLRVRYGILTSCYGVQGRGQRGMGNQGGDCMRGRAGVFGRFFLHDFTFAFIGIGILRFWYQYNLYNLHSTTDFGIGVAWSNILRGAVGLFLVACALRGELSPRVRNVLVWGSLILMTASGAFNFLELVTKSTSFEVARYVTCGLGLVWGGGMWMDFFSRLKPTRAFLYLVTALAFSCLLSLVAGYLPSMVMGLINLFVPAFAILAFWRAMHQLDLRDAACPPVPQTDFRYSELHASDVRQIGLSFVLFAFVLGITLGFPDGHPRELDQFSRSIHQLTLVAVLVGVLAWVFVHGGTFKFTSVWGVENVILITAIVLLVEESDVTRTLATALFLSAESFFYSFVFFTCYDIGRRTHRPAVFILGIFYSLALAAMGAGRLFSTRIDVLPGGMVAMLVIMSTLVVVEMVMALRLGIFKSDIPLFVEVRGDGEEADEVALRAMGEAAAQSFQPASVAPVPAVPEPAPDAQRLAHLAAEAGLTQTEEQIALLVVRGRSRAVIARELGYSANTVRNYTHTLYSKLGIHSKQELIDLVEGSSQVQ